MYKKKIIYYFLVTLSLLVLSGCAKKSIDSENLISITPTVTEQPTLTPTQAVTQPPERKDEMKSYLTGMWVSKEIGTKRPLAYVFNNYKTVSNQWGIGQADIVYECLAEGGITRLLGIGENFSGDRLGSTRSARQYFVSIADEYDAIFVHFGGSTYGYDKIKELGIDEIDGITGKGGSVFYRDKTMKAPHNAFSSQKLLQEGIKKIGFETEYPTDYKSHFTFYEEDSDLTDGTAADGKISVHFSNYNKPYFEYSVTEKLYYRYQFGAPHVDSLTGDQLTFKNIIIQFVKEWNLDKKGYQGMDLENASGSGYYFTNGKKIDITWKKNESERFMRYYDKDGKELTINPGKTYAALFPDNRVDEVIID